MGHMIWGSKIMVPYRGWGVGFTCGTKCRESGLNHFLNQFWSKRSWGGRGLCSHEARSSRCKRRSVWRQNVSNCIVCFSAAIWGHFLHFVMRCFVPYSNCETASWIDRQCDHIPHSYCIELYTYFLHLLFLGLGCMGNIESARRSFLLIQRCLSNAMLFRTQQCTKTSVQTPKMVMGQGL